MAELTRICKTRDGTLHFDSERAELVQVSFEFETKYELKNELGRGGMGTVYKAVDRESNRPLAIKFFRGTLFDDNNMRQHFLQEADILRDLSARDGHPNLVKVFGRGSESGALYIAFEFVEGKTLRELIDSDGELTLGQVVEMVRQICFGLSALHQRQVVHMDLKPLNIMLPKGGGLKIIDLGVSLTREQRKRQAQGGDGIILGTPQYMSPEQCSEGAITYSSDLYALGVIFYELLVGAPPFWGSTMDVVEQHLTKTPTLPSKRGVVIPHPIEELLLQLLAKDPVERPKSAVFLRNALQKMMKEVDGNILVGDAARRLAREQSAQATPRRIKREKDEQATPKVLERNQRDDDSTPKVEDLAKVRKPKKPSRPRSGVKRRPSKGVASVSSVHKMPTNTNNKLKFVIVLLLLIIVVLLAVIAF